MSVWLPKQFPYHGNTTSPLEVKASGKNARKALTRVLSLDSDDDQGDDFTMESPNTAQFKHRLDVGLVGEGYRVERFKVPFGTRPTEKVFAQAGFKLYDGQSDDVPDNCFLSDHHAVRLLFLGEQSYETHPADFTSDGRIRASRTNKGQAAKVLVKDTWYYEEVMGYAFLGDEGAMRGLSNVTYKRIKCIEQKPPQSSSHALANSQYQKRRRSTSSPFLAESLYTPSRRFEQVLDQADNPQHTKPVNLLGWLEYGKRKQTGYQSVNDLASTHQSKRTLDEGPVHTDWTEPSDCYHDIPPTTPTVNRSIPLDSFTGPPSEPMPISENDPDYLPPPPLKRLKESTPSIQTITLARATRQYGPALKNTLTMIRNTMNVLNEEDRLDKHAVYDRLAMAYTEGYDIMVKTGKMLDQQGLRNLVWSDKDIEQGSKNTSDG